MMTVCAGRLTPHASVAVQTSTCGSAAAMHMCVRVYGCVGGYRGRRDGGGGGGGGGGSVAATVAPSTS